MRGVFLSALIATIAAGCLTAPAPILDHQTGNGGSGGGSAPGSAGTTGSGGTASGIAGDMGTGGAQSGIAGDTGTGGAGTGGAGADSTGSAGSSGAAGAGDGGASMAGSGGNSNTGAGGRGGVTGGAGRGGGGGTAGTTGNAGRGGTTGVAGTTGTGGTTGTAGTTGAGGTTSACMVLDNLRLDDPCGSLLSGNACLHKGKTTDDGTVFTAMKPVVMGGTTGTTYQVKLHFRGVVEPTHIMSGTPGTPANFLTGGTRFPDGSQESTYQQWRLTTTNPNQHYYLNAYNSVGLSHIVNLIDYQQTIPIAAGATVTLDVYDGNAHEISNTVNTPPLAPSGVPGSMSSGQFMQINVDGCN
jgi:hypothetical protein